VREAMLRGADEASLAMGRNVVIMQVPAYFL
jgi:hypothetical protein